MYSYSKVGCFWDCPYKYKLIYKDKLKAKFDEKPTNALVLGTALHESIETKNIDEALEKYFKNYKEVVDENKFEAYKVRKVAERAIEELPRGTYEFKLLVDDFIGFIDLLVEVETGLYDVYDFKYSNNVNAYLESPQVHLYKYYFEKQTGLKVRNLHYVFLPKVDVKFSDRPLEELYKEVDEAVAKAQIRIEQVEYDQKKVSFFFARKASLLKAEEKGSYEKRNTWKCKGCEFKTYCLNGDTSCLQTD